MKTEKNRRLSLRNEKTVTVWITIERVHENKTKKEKKKHEAKKYQFCSQQVFRLPDICIPHSSTFFHIKWLPLDRIALGVH